MTLKPPAKSKLKKAPKKQAEKRRASAKPKPRGVPPHKPTATTRAKVEAMAACGIRQDDIAAIIEIAPKTLRLHYRRELDVAAAKANAQVAGGLFKAAVGGDTTSQIFWLKTRAGWSTTEKLELTGEDGAAIETTQLTPEEAAKLYKARMKGKE